MSSELSRSSPFDAAVDAASNEVLSRSQGLDRPVILIDGRSGSGKSTLGGLLARRWGAPITVLALDDVYPGWDGLDAGVAEVLRHVLRPRRAGDAAAWQRWDWELAAPSEWHRVDPAAPLVVEGSGILTPDAAELADLTVWLSSPAASRRERALARDGEAYRPHWERWAAQEEGHLSRDRPEDLADLVAEIP